MGIILFQLFINYIFFTFYDAGAWKWYRIAAIFAFPAFVIQMVFLAYLSINIYTYAPTEISFERQLFIVDSVIFGVVSAVIQTVILYKASKIRQLILLMNNKIGISSI